MANPVRPLLADLGDIPQTGVFHLHDGGEYVLDMHCMDWMLPRVETQWGEVPLIGPNQVNKKALLDSGCLRSLYTPSTFDVSTEEVAADICRVLIMQKCAFTSCQHPAKTKNDQTI